MRVTVRLFARLRDIAGAASWRATSPPARRSATSGRRSRGEFPELGRLRASISCAVNADYARM